MSHSDSVAENLGLSRNTVNKYLDLFALSCYTYEELLRRYRPCRAHNIKGRPLVVDGPRHR